MRKRLLHPRLRFFGKALLPGALLLLLAATGYPLGGPGEPSPIYEQGESYLALKDLARMHQGRLIQEEGNRLVLDAASGRISFFPGSRRMESGGVTLWLHAPVRKVRKKWMLSESDYRYIVQPILNPSLLLRGRDCRVILIDPGHGGKDCGAVGHGLQEKDVVLQIARALRAELAQKGFRVLMTREFDRFIPLEERSARAEDGQVDLFISLHLNAAANPEAQGVETYTLTARGYAPTQKPAPISPDRTQDVEPGHAALGASQLLGYALHRNLIRGTGSLDRGLRHAGFQVLRENSCPSVLVELGFLSHADEAAKLAQENYQKEVVQGLARGVRDYASWIRQAVDLVE